MKRHFSFGFKALAACAMSAMLAVSCYDDSKLWEEIEGLEERVAALEEKLNTEVSTLNSKLGTLETAYKAGDAALAESVAALTEELDALDGTVDGYIKSNDAALKAAIDELKKADAALADVDTDVLLSLAKLGVVSVEEDKDGKVVITFVDESTLEIANEAGVVTIVDGKWAVVVDGEVTVLDALVHPDTTLDFRVGDDNTLYVSYDGKKTWESTGVVVNDETTFNVVSGYEYNEEEGYLSLTIGEVEYQLPIYQPDNSSLVLGRTDVFFNFGTTKSIELLAEGISEYYVMAKPDGWKTTLEGTTLAVTAPSKDLVELGAGEASGEVLVHATSVTGTCKVVKLDVSTGEAMTISYLDGDITVFTAYAEDMGGYTGFVDLYLGITPIEELLSYDSVEDLIRAQYVDYELTNSFGSILTIANNLELVNPIWYEPGINEELTINTSISELTDPSNSWAVRPVEYDKDKNYVVWLVPQGETEMEPRYAEAVYTTTGAYVSFVAGNSTYNNVEFSTNFVGADGYIVGATDKASIEQNAKEYQITLEEALAEYFVNPYNSYQPGQLGSFINGDKTAMGEMYTSEASVVNLADVILKQSGGGGGMPIVPMPGGSSSAIEPDSEYYIWVLPYYENKPLASYKYADVLVYTCKTAPLTEDESAKPNVEFIPGYETIEYTITPPTGAVTKYSNFIPYDDYVAEYLTENVLNVEKVLNEAVEWEAISKYNYVDSYNITPSTKYVMLTYTTLGGHYYCEAHEVQTLSSFAEFVSALPAGATLMLTEDVVLTESIEVRQDLKLNLNGFTLSLDETVAATDATAAVIVYAGNVTITGEYDGGTIATSGKAAHKNAGAVWVRGTENANVTIENVVLKGNNWDETAEGQTDCMATVYVSNPNGYVTINSGEFYCVQQTQVEGQNQILNYKNSFPTKNIVVKGGTFYGMDPAKGNGVEVSYVAEGLVSAEIEDGVYVVTETPDGKQWIIDAYADGWGYFTGAEDMGRYAKGLFDLGVNAENTLILALNYKDLYGSSYPDTEPEWGFINHFMPVTGYKVTPTGESTGTITWTTMGHFGEQSCTVNYEYYDTSCGFEFVELGIYAWCEPSTNKVTMDLSVLGGGIGGGPEL